MPPHHELPLVSIIVIFLNAARFIEEAIESVFRQSYTRWELLLVDDGSTDESTEIAKRYAALDSARVRYLEHPGHVNRGMSAARNLGIGSARGELVALLDSDDVWLPIKLQRQVAVMLAEPEIGMVCGAPKYWTSWSGAGDLRPDEVVCTGGPQNQVSYPPSLLTELYPLGSGVSPCPSDLMLRRDLLLRLQGFEEQFVGMYEDQALLAKVYLTAPVYISSETWLLYRRRADSCVANARREGRYHHARRTFLAWLDRYLTNRRVADPAILDSLRRARRPYRYSDLFFARSTEPAIQIAASRLSAGIREVVRRARRSLRTE